MKKTCLYNQHIKLNAKLVPYAGYLMPVQYDKGIKNEYNAVRNSAGLFDVSHMGEFKISGLGAENFLQMMTINNVEKLSFGQAQYSAMCSKDGGIIDDLILYKFKDYYLMVVNASNIEKNWNWLKTKCPNNVKLENISDNISLIALQGPNSREIIKALIPEVNDLSFYHAFIKSINGNELIVSRTGYTGELGFEIYGSKQSILEIWKIYINSDQVSACGLAVRDILRMEMKYCLYGNDICQDTNPIEAGLGWITDLNKDFVGKDSILNSIEKKQTKRLVAFKLNDRGIPRKGYEIYSNGESIGRVTSGTHSLGLNKGIGIAFLENGFHHAGSEIKINIRNKMVLAKVVEPPFIKNTSLFS